MVKIKSSESFSFDNCQEKNLEYIRVSSYEQKRKFSWCQMSYIEQSKSPGTTVPSIEKSLYYLANFHGLKDFQAILSMFPVKWIPS